MSDMLQKSFNDFLQNVTPEMVAEKKKLFEEYMNREYKGKPWRRLSNEEIVALEDKDLLNQIESLSKLSDDTLVMNGPVVMESSDEREITGNQSFVVGHGGDLGGPDGVAYETDEDWAKLDVEIEDERKRIYSLVTSPPRASKYLDIFKKKFPNRTEKELMAGFVLSENGVHSQDYNDWMDRQNKSHVKSGENRLEITEVARREEVTPENKDALAFGSNETTMAIHREVLREYKVASNDINNKMKEGFRESIIAQSKFEVAGNDGFVPEEDLIDPIRYKNNGDAVEMPVDELFKQQRDSLKITEIVRHIPSKGDVNGKD